MPPRTLRDVAGLPSQPIALRQAVLVQGRELM
jgi:hypothetical protein